MFPKRRIAAVFLALVLSAPALPADLQAGMAAERGDYATALKERRPLAEPGDGEAQYRLGHVYLSGEGVPQDYAEAVMWFRLAAEQGCAEAQSQLGLMYYYGEGVTPDHVQAHMWFNLAATGMPPGEPLDTAVKYRDLVEKRMTPAQIAEAQQRARDWKPK